MSVLDKHRHLLDQKIADMPVGSEGGLASIFGADWAVIGTTGERRNFGIKFKAAVKSLDIKDLEWVRIENSGRYDVYRKK